MRALILCGGRGDKAKAKLARRFGVSCKYDAVSIKVVLTRIVSMICPLFGNIDFARRYIKAG